MICCTLQKCKIHFDDSQTALLKEGIYVGYLPSQITRDEFRQYVQEYIYGDTDAINKHSQQPIGRYGVMDNHTQTSTVLSDSKQGELFAFTKFQNLEAAQGAVRRMNNIEFKGKRLNIYLCEVPQERRKNDKHDAGDDTQIYVGNLPVTKSSEIINVKYGLESTFAKFGDIDEIYIPKDGRNDQIERIFQDLNFTRVSRRIFGGDDKPTEVKLWNSRTFAYIKFHTPQAANNAISCLNNINVLGKRVMVNNYHQKCENEICLFLGCAKLAAEEHVAYISSVEQQLDINNASSNLGIALRAHAPKPILLRMKRRMFYDKQLRQQAIQRHEKHFNADNDYYESDDFLDDDDEIDETNGGHNYVHDDDYDDYGDASDFSDYERGWNMILS